MGFTAMQSSFSIEKGKNVRWLGSELSVKKKKQTKTNIVFSFYPVVESAGSNQNLVCHVSYCKNC